MTTTNAKHSSTTNEHYTPAHVIKLVRTLLRNIDTDPASCVVAQQVVRADEWWGPDAPHPTYHDGLSDPWYGRTFLNPPGGKVGKRSSAVVWWEKLLSEHASGSVSAAIFLAFNIEFLQLAQSSWRSPLYFPLCIPRKRIAFDTLDDNGTRVPGKNPPHANAIIYLPDTTEHISARDRSTARFCQVFAELGDVVVP